MQSSPQLQTVMNSLSFSIDLLDCLFSIYNIYLNSSCSFHIGMVCAGYSIGVSIITHITNVSIL